MLTLVLLLMTPLTTDPAGIVAPAEGPSRRSSGTCAVVVLSPDAATPRARDDSGGRAPDRSPARQTRSRAVRVGPSFSAARTVDLPLAAVVRRNTPAERLELRLYTPKGHLYQMLRATPPPDTEAGSQTRAPWTAVLPVAGTAIVNHSLYGRWRVEPHLDGNPRPCGPPQLFYIEP
jgi:hypothetical protein